MSDFKPVPSLRHLLTTHRIGGPFKDINDKLEVSVMATDDGSVGSRYQISQTAESQKDSDPLAWNPIQIHFQDRPEKVSGVLGATNEALIAILINRLEGFQDGELACQENAEAIIYLWQALRCLHNRTIKRVVSGVEGTHSK